MAKSCCNPYKKGHSKNQQKHLQRVTDFEKCRAIFPNLEWSEGMYLCTSCRMKIFKEYTLLIKVREGVRLAQQHRKTTSVSATFSGEERSSKKHNQDNEFLPSAPEQHNLYPDISTHNQNEPRPGTSKDLTGLQSSPTPLGSIVTSSLAASQVSASTSSSSYHDEGSDALNRTLEAAGLSPMRPSDWKKANIVRKKYDAIKKKAKTIIQKVGNVDASPDANKQRKCVFCKLLLEELSEKFPNQTTRSEKYKLLTSIPKRYTIAEVSSATGCSLHLAKVASALKNDKGAFSFPPQKTGRALPEKTTKAVQLFYQSEDNSRVSPGLRDCIIVKNAAGLKEPVPKRRLLHNLNDLYQLFKLQNSNIPISLTSFAKLRPKNCTWPGLKGYHTTCVCEIHQNFEFLLQAIGFEKPLAEFIESVLCPSQDSNRPDCHLGLCEFCPNKDALEEILRDVMEDEEISYNQWVHTDFTDMRVVTVTSEQFKQIFLEYVPKVILHEHVTKKQKESIRFLRTNLIRDTAAVTVQVDFAQNFTFVIQNAVQGYHWSNRQATVHPFVVHYYEPESSETKYKTYCIISDELNHDAESFHVYRSEFLRTMKEDFKDQGIQKIYYISDGAGSQYKNFKNFANLMCHKTDFDLDAEWHFTATSHGKSTCDAISAFVKCSARRESLIRGAFITTPLQLFRYCEAKLTTEKLVFLYITKNDIAPVRSILKERYNLFRPIQGTRKHHMFKPKDNNTMSLGITSDALITTDINFRVNEITYFSLENLTIGKFYAFYEASNYHIGLLVEDDLDEGDVKLQVMKLNRRSRKLWWPDPLTFLDVACRDILLELSEPSSDNGTDYYISVDEMKVVRIKFNQFKGGRNA